MEKENVLDLDFDPSQLDGIDDIKPEDLKRDEPSSKLDADEDSIAMPIEFKIGDKMFYYTPRPWGYIRLISNEILKMTQGVENIIMLFNGRLSSEFKDSDGNTMSLNSEKVTEFLLSAENSTIDSAVRIAQLILQPIDIKNPCAPIEEDMVLTKEYAEWAMSPYQFTNVLSTFYARDIAATGYNLKNILSLGA